jgi:hypothetical protein
MSDPGTHLVELEILELRGDERCRLMLPITELGVLMQMVSNLHHSGCDGVDYLVDRAVLGRRRCGCDSENTCEEQMSAWHDDPSESGNGYRMFE